MRTVIAHGHIFKNAGTTFDWSLERNFGSGFCDHRENKPMRLEGKEYLDQYINKHVDLKAISSHHLCSPLPKSKHYRIIPCFFIRHPIERMWSAYKFERAQKGPSLGAKMAKVLDFKEYVLWRLRDDVPNTIRDYQTAYLSGAFSGKATAYVNYGHYQAAADLVLKSSFVGIVDRYDESMVVFEENFKSKGISLELAYKPQNVGDKRVLSQAAKVESVLEQLGSEANRALEGNLNDIRLYNYANIKLDDKINSISGFESKLEQFKLRCRAL